MRKRRRKAVPPCIPVEYNNPDLLIRVAQYFEGNVDSVRGCALALKVEKGTMEKTVRVLTEIGTLPCVGYVPTHGMVRSKVYAKKNSKT